MGRLDLLDPPRDEDAFHMEAICGVCGQWNRGTSAYQGLRVCGRSSCLGEAVHRARLAETLISDEEALD